MDEGDDVWITTASHNHNVWPTPTMWYITSHLVLVGMDGRGRHRHDIGLSRAMVDVGRIVEIEGKERPGEACKTEAVEEVRGADLLPPTATDEGEAEGAVIVHPWQAVCGYVIREPQDEILLHASMPD